MDQNFSYVSCIKINGVPILPPLVTSDRKQELLEYKRQALLLEKQYSNKKLNSKTFGNESKSVHGEFLGLESNISCNSKNQTGNSLIYVPFKNENLKKLNLSSSIIDVSEYSSDTKEISENKGIIEVKIIETDTCHPTLHKDNYNSDSLDLISGSTEIVLKEDTSDLGNEKNICEKPRLIRSNSYTLDNPSPLLLAHLKRQSSVSLSSDQGLTDSSHEEIESIVLESRAEKKNNSEIQSQKIPQI
ncbi:hypothetical protein WA026_015069 [Henosepilachna vigintioctopunctata]|uniref:Uncharacterized protein n=1 Tax=Henosepilachna vigintioctopunctata TaxID=420089 RepID=A0AAW1U2Q2_9CUCU